MKRFSAFLLSLALLMGLSGCGLTITPPSAAPVPLKFWCSIPYEDGPRQLLEDFNASHPDIEVQYVYYVNDEIGHGRLDKALATDGDVDLCLGSSRNHLLRRAERGWLLPLNGMLARRAVDVSTLYGPGAELFRLEDTYYSLPTRLFNQCILLNEQMFRDKGVPLPRAGWTYEEFLSAAQQLSGDGVYGYFSGQVDQGEPALAFLRAQLGEDWMYTEDGCGIAIDRPEVKYALDQYLYRSQSGIEPDFTANKTQRMLPEDMFLRGKAAMILDRWTVRHVKDLDRYPHDFKVGFATLPKLGGEDQKELFTSVYSDDISISASTLYPEEAMTFLLWYVTEGIHWLTPKGLIPCTLRISPADTAASLFAGSEQLFDMDSARAVYLTSQDARSPRYFTASQEIHYILGQEFEKAFTGACSVDEALKTAQRRAQTAFDESK